LEELPPEIRQVLDKTLGSSSIEELLKKRMPTEMKIIFNGKEYDNAGSMPADEREMYEAAMKWAGKHGADQEIPMGGRKSISASVDPPGAIVPESSLPPVRWLIAGAVLIGLLGLLVGFSFLFSR
jgi:hypothetical protein